MGMGKRLGTRENRCRESWVSSNISFHDSSLFIMVSLFFTADWRLGDEGRLFVNQLLLLPPAADFQSLPTCSRESTINQFPSLVSWLGTGNRDGWPYLSFSPVLWTTAGQHVEWSWQGCCQEITNMLDPWNGCWLSNMMVTTLPSFRTFSLSQPQTFIPLFLEVDWDKEKEIRKGKRFVTLKVAGRFLGATFTSANLFLPLLFFIVTPKLSTSNHQLIHCVWMLEAWALTLLFLLGLTNLCLYY